RKSRDVKHPAAQSPYRKPANSEPEKRKQASYTSVMNTGRAALAAKHYEEAIEAFTEAGKLRPHDPEAAALLKQAVSLRAAARAAAAANERKSLEEQRLVTDFLRLMAQGQTDMTAKRYEAAVTAYGQAVKLDPKNAAAAKGLRDAQQALDAARQPKPKLA